MSGSLAAGSVLQRRYRIVQLLGAGGFGAIYKACDERFQGARVVAIKEMSDANLTASARAQALKDFRREATLLVQLNHPNLPNVSDFFEENGKVYLVMEFIEGKTLDEVQDETKGPLDEAQVMGWAVQLCSVLQYLHTRQPPIIFRDMKPSNIMLAKDNQLKLIDFGIARVFKASATKDTTRLGSQGYAPLEQYGRGQSDQRSDIYALGATLYQLLTNHVPADAPSRRINPQVFETPRQLNPRISQATENIILMAMEQDPDERFQSAEAMQRAILDEGFVSTTSTLGTTITTASTRHHLTQQAPPTASDTAHSTTPVTPGASSPSTKATWQETILPLAVALGSTILQAIKERNMSKAVSNTSPMTQPPTSDGRRQTQMMMPPVQQAAPPRRSFASRSARAIDNVFIGILSFLNGMLNLIGTLVTLLLLARCLLTFFHLNLGDFSSWVYNLSNSLAAPFGYLLVPIHASATTTYTLDVSTIVAIVVYAIIIGIVSGILRSLTKRRRHARRYSS
jgi:serine/threonine protein kinase